MVEVVKLVNILPSWKILALWVWSTSDLKLKVSTH